MTDITPYSRLNSNNIDHSDYMNTLIPEAVRAGLINDSDVDRIRNDLMSALAEVIGYYTKQESSSVKADTANELSESMIYNIDTYLRSLGDDKAALETLLDRKMDELYGKGYVINSKHYEKAKILYGKARYSRLKNGSEEYNKTLDKYFRYYLSNYSPKFSAHNKIYLSLKEYDLNGVYHIDEAVDVLNKILEINHGPQADYIIDTFGNANSIKIETDE